MELIKNTCDKFWSFRIYDYEKGKTNIYTINLMNRENYIKNKLPPIIFDSEINLPTEYYQDFIKKTKEIHSEKVTVKIVKNSIQFICNNSDISSNITFNNISNFNHTIATSDFSYKDMLLCTHFSQLCHTMSIYFKPSFIIILKYTIGNLGEIMVCLTPI